MPPKLVPQLEGSFFFPEAKEDLWNACPCLPALEERGGHGESVYLHLYDLNDTFAHMNSARMGGMGDARIRCWESHLHHPSGGWIWWFWLVKKQRRVCKSWRNNRGKMILGSGILPSKILVYMSHDYIFNSPISLLNLEPTPHWFFVHFRGWWFRGQVSLDLLGLGGALHVGVEASGSARGSWVKMQAIAVILNGVGWCFAENLG